MKSEFYRESGMVAHGSALFGAIKPEIVSVSTGSYGSVEFDFLEVFAFIQSKKDFRPENLHFYHVHPPGIESASATDLLCAKALKVGLGFSPLFSIINFLSDDPLSFTCRETHYRLEDGVLREWHISDLYAMDGGRLLGAMLHNDHLLLLKTLSYLQPSETECATN